MSETEIPEGCDFPRCECMMHPENCAFAPKNRRKITAETIKTIDLTRRPAPFEEKEKDDANL